MKFCWNYYYRWSCVFVQLSTNTRTITSPNNSSSYSLVFKWNPLIIFHPFGKKNFSIKSLGSNILKEPTRSRSRCSPVLQPPTRRQYNSSTSAHVAEPSRAELDSNRFGRSQKLWPYGIWQVVSLAVGKHLVCAALSLSLSSSPLSLSHSANSKSFFTISLSLPKGPLHLSSQITLFLVLPFSFSHNLQIHYCHLNRYLLCLLKIPALLISPPNFNLIVVVVVVVVAHCFQFLGFYLFKGAPKIVLIGFNKVIAFQMFPA